MSTYIRLISRTQKSHQSGSDISHNIQSMAMLIHDFLLVPEFYYLPLEITSQVFFTTTEQFSKEESRYILERFGFQLQRDPKAAVEKLKSSEKNSFSGLELMSMLKEAMSWPEETERVQPMPPILNTSPPKPYMDLLDNKFERSKRNYKKEFEKQSGRLQTVVDQISIDMQANNFKIEMIEKAKQEKINQLREESKKRIDSMEEKCKDIETQIENISKRINSPLTEEEHNQIMSEQNLKNKEVIKELNNNLQEEVQKLHVDLQTLGNKRNDPEKQREEAKRKLEEKREKKEAIKKQKEEERQKRIQEQEKKKEFERSLVEVPEKLLNNFVYPKKIYKIQPIYKPKDDFVMPKHVKTFFDAIYLNDSQKLVEFIQKNPKIVNEYGEGRLYPLHVATKFDKPEMVKLLIVNGADPNVKDPMGRTPLHYATIYEREQIIGLLKGSKVDVDLKDKEGFTALDLLHEREAARKEAYNSIREINRRKMAEYFKRWPDIVTYRYKGGMQLIHIAAYYGLYETVELLLQWGADINVKDDKGNTPFHYAIIGGEYECIQFFIDHGGDLHALNNDNKQPFDYFLPKSED